MLHHAPLLIGRAAELDVVARVLTNTSARRGHTLFVTGEPGIGKSRLADLTANRAVESGMTVLRGRSSAICPIVPLRPLTEALLALLRDGEPLDDAELGPYRSILGALIPEWRPPGPQRHESVVVLAEAVLRLLAAIGRHRGCLLVLEDLHEIDAETLSVLEYLVDNIRQQPVMIMVTLRSEDCSTMDLARVSAARRTGSLLTLDRLDAAQVHVLIAARLGVPPDDVPSRVVRRLFRDSAGNPFMVEELLTAMISADHLQLVAGGWRLVDDERVDMPDTLVWAITQQTERLAPDGRRLLSIAAVLGHEFPLPVVRAVLGVDEEEFFHHLRAAVAARLVTPAELAPDWYAFHHPLTAEALLVQLTPADRAALSRRAADAVQQLCPDLPGQWCQLAAVLRENAGQPAEAGWLFAEGGRRALVDGAANSAVALLDRANNLLASHGDVEVHTRILEFLLPALAEAGEFERVSQLAATLHGTDTDWFDPQRRAMLHIRLATTAEIAGRWADGNAQVARAQVLLGPDPPDHCAANLDVVTASLALESPGPDRIRLAGELAQRAVVTAQRAALPSAECQAWDLLGVLARDEDWGRSTECFRNAQDIAERHQLALLGIHALVQLAVNEWMTDGDIGPLTLAREEAMRAGAIVVAYNADAMLALDRVLTGEFAQAAQQVGQCHEDVTRLRIDAMIRYNLISRAVLAAHRCRRTEMADALTEFRRHGGAESPALPLATGLAGAFCALLEEDVSGAEDELARVRTIDQANPSTFQLTGRHGLSLLLDVLAGRLDQRRFTRLASAAAARLRWNRQFVELARAVLLGRSGRSADAESAMAQARQLGSRYATALHLGGRLVAEEAFDHGWGDPESWLRGAEIYFHLNAVPAVASACRTILRDRGLSAPQRRTGTDRIPAELFALGVTLREYEILELLAHRLTNKAIATRLHISHRTVEKHIASLMAKTGQDNRSALGNYVAGPQAH